MSEWKECKLGDVVTFQRGYDLPKTQMAEGKFPVAGSNGIIGYHNEFTTKGPGVTIGRSGNIGTPVFYKTDFWAHNTVLFVKDFKNSDPKFIYYFLKKIDFSQFNAGSAVPTLNRNHIHELDVLLPPLPEQRSIASILSSLDDKIDLLHRQNKTLEALAETLFKQWFVEEAEEGWEEKGLDELADFLNGLACQKYPPVAGKESLPVIKIKELREGITDATDMATSEVPGKYIVNDGDILFSWSGSLELVIWSHGKGILNQHLFKVSSDRYPEWFFYFWIKHHLPEFRNIAQDKATTMGHIQRHHLTDALVTVPPDEQLQRLDTQMKPLFTKIKGNLTKILILTRLRDTLLPKLISGEIRIKNIEKFNGVIK